MSVDFQRNIQSGNIIEAEDYNELAQAINLIYHDDWKQERSSVLANEYYLLDSHERYDSRILNIISVDFGGSRTHNFTTIDSSGNNIPTTINPTDDFIVVFLGGELLEKEGNYNLSANNITFFNHVEMNQPIIAYNRSSEMLGWGQLNRSIEIDTSSANKPLISADSGQMNSYIQSNTNGIIDKVNIMLDRTKPESVDIQSIVLLDGETVEIITDGKHYLENDDMVEIDGVMGTTELNGNTYTISKSSNIVLSGDSFLIRNEHSLTPGTLDSTSSPAISGYMSIKLDIIYIDRTTAIIRTRQKHNLNAGNRVHLLDIQGASELNNNTFVVGRIVDEYQFELSGATINNDYTNGGIVEIRLNLTELKVINSEFIKITTDLNTNAGGESDQSNAVGGIPTMTTHGLQENSMIGFSGLPTGYDSLNSGEYGVLIDISFDSFTLDYTDGMNFSDYVSGGVVSYTVLSRTSTGDIIEANDKKLIQHNIQNSILLSNYYNNEIFVMRMGESRNHRVNPWQSKLTLTWRWTFNDYNHCRYYFNAGGELKCGIRFDSNVDDNWEDAIGNAGDIRMNYKETIINPSAEGSNTVIGSNVGFYTLFADWQTISRSLGTLDADQRELHEFNFLNFPHLIDSGEYSDYSIPVQVLFESRLNRTQTQPDSSGRISISDYFIEIRITLDNTIRVSPVVANIYSYADYIAPSSINNNSAMFSIMPPTITLTDSFNEITDL